MLDCISVENMRRSDAFTIAHHVPSLELMGRAAEGVFRATCWKAPVAILCGSGNNGGDGFALACILKTQNIECTLFTISEKMSADSAFYARKAREMGVTVKAFTPNCLQGFSCIADCLLGTGFQGELRDSYRAVIEAINASDAYVVSVDINSGMNGDSGDCQLAVRSHLTVTIGYVKTGLVTPNAGAYMKRLVCADIGILLEREEWKLSESEDSSDPRVLRCPPWLDTTIIQVR